MGTDGHGFEVGRTYRDRNGAYQVLRIDAAAGTIDTQDELGNTRAGEDAALKWRIWCNVGEAAPRREARRPAVAPKPVATPETIESICRQRAVQAVVHFTAARNVPSILRHGLVPRARHRTLGLLDVEYGDSIRLDQRADAVPVSIGFPDWQMFQSLRSHDPDKPWAVVVTSPSVLWMLECAFYETREASGSTTSAPAPDRRGIPSFKRLFDDTDWGLRMQAGVPPALPTDPQAEVLVFGTIPPSMFQAIHVESVAARAVACSGADSAVPVHVDSRYFIPRVDWKARRRDRSIIKHDAHDAGRGGTERV